MQRKHSFHIPVMGIGYTIDTPAKVAHLGIDSVVSLVDDMIIEKFRKFYCNKYKVFYQEISEKVEDYRAKRITSYLNLLNKVADDKINELKELANKKSSEIKEYFCMMSDSSEIKKEFKALQERFPSFTDFRSWIQNNITKGSIDVNIMSKIDKDNYKNGKKLPVEFNDAHAAARGFANSNLSSTIVLSAGMNPKLYNYLEKFDDFFPDSFGEIKKKIALKVSDFKSALIQGKYFAKKGIWISEYRVESGLNCGGHAFATNGLLLGPILAEFRDKRRELTNSIKEVFEKALSTKKRIIPEKELDIKITAQGGVGTAEEHDFLLEHYKVDSVGWGSPFLLVPDAVTIDSDTIEKLKDANEDNLYLSNISPLGIPFNNLRNNTKDLEKLSFIKNGKPGSFCLKKYVALNSEFSEQPICTASRRYQKKKLEELREENLAIEDYQKEEAKVVDKSCICVGLGTSALIASDIETKAEGEGVSVCPGPNMAYFSKTMSLKEITDHIYGRSNMIQRIDRPNMFIKELKMYIDFLKEKIEKSSSGISQKENDKLHSFANNLKDGISYYLELFGEIKDKFQESKNDILQELDNYKITLKTLKQILENRRISL